MNRLTPLSALPTKRQTPHRCHYPPPQRAWEQTYAGWISRPWQEGEQELYAAEVLHQS